MGVTKGFKRICLLLTILASLFLFVNSQMVLSETILNNSVFVPANNVTGWVIEFQAGVEYHFSFAVEGEETITFRMFDTVNYEKWADGLANVIAEITLIDVQSFSDEFVTDITETFHLILDNSNNPTSIYVSMYIEIVEDVSTETGGGVATTFTVLGIIGTIGVGLILVVVSVKGRSRAAKMQTQLKPHFLRAKESIGKNNLFNPSNSASGTVKFCPNCKSEIAMSEHYCSFCGYKFLS